MKKVERFCRKWIRAKNKMKAKVNLYLSNPTRLMHRFKYRMLCNSAWGRSLPDDVFLKKLYRLHFGKELDLENPKTFNEKLQWLKLHDHNPEYPQIVDKVGFKEYVTEKFGAEYVVPVIGIWDDVDDIDFDALPDKFVMKCTHDSGSFLICTDKNNIDWLYWKKRMKKLLKRNYFWLNREWPYKELKPRIIIEPNLAEKPGQSIRNVKFFCFDGEPEFLLIGTNSSAGDDSSWDVDFFDMDFNHLPFQFEGTNAKELPHKPENWDKMIEMSRELSKGIPHVRVDFLETEGRIYLGELTFYTATGMGKFTPEEWDLKLGEFIKLPNKTEE